MSLFTVDLEVIAYLRSLCPNDGGVFLREILTMFIDDVPARLHELQDSLKAGNVATFVRAAHNIKGSSSNVGARELRALAEQLEDRAKNSGLDDVGTSVAELEAAFDRVRNEFKKLLAA